LTHLYGFLALSQDNHRYRMEDVNEKVA